MKVAVLCCSINSVYKKIPDVDTYDIKRDARTFQGGCPIVAHPPCRAWSAFTRHQAKPVPGEKELGLYCAEILRKEGGILEHPAHSHLFAEAGLPKPGETKNDLQTIAVWQVWWGYPMKKATWLCFSGIDPYKISLPFRLHAPGRDRRKQQLMSHTQRAATTYEFAQWLVRSARLASQHECLGTPS